MSSSWSSPSSVDNVQISDITIKASKTIHSIKVSIEGTFQHKVNLARGLKETRITLPTPRPKLSSSTPLIIKVRLGLFNKPSKKITHQDLLSNVSTVATNKREYRTIFNEVEVIVGFIVPQASREIPVTDTNLTSTTDEIFNICPRFRVLVIGRTGAGKTSLIRNTFGVTEARISHGQVGECDINKELFSIDENRRFVLHDSKGFEPAEVDNFETVIKFLNKRKAEPDIKNQVHAVWLCFSISVSGDRLFETGAENFLQMLSDGRLGGMPIIAIFTKYDNLVDHICFFENPGQKTKAELLPKASARWEELCVKPFKAKISGNTSIPVIRVSTDEEYKWTLHELTQLTTKLVGQYLTADIAVVSAVAQQVSPTVKLDAVIAVGKKRYWKGLTGVNSETVLQNIHQDIVNIWNLQDPDKLLDSFQFKARIIKIVDNDPNLLTIKNSAPSLTILATLAGTVSALVAPVVAPIVIPIVAVLAAGHWTTLLLRQGRDNLQSLMTYIVSLTLIMQNVFAITTSTNNVVTRLSIHLALKRFLDSAQEKIILSIKEHLQNPFKLAQFGRDASLQKMTELIQSKSLSPDDMARIKTELQGVNIEEEVPW